MSVQVEFSTITEMFERLTEKFRNSQRPVLMHKVDGSYRGISYSELRDRTYCWAHGLASLGVRRGDRIVMLSENRPEWVVADMGMLALGAVNVPIFPTLTPKQISFITQDAGAEYVIVSNQLQYSKIVKVRAELPSIKKIITMFDQAPIDDGAVVSFSRLYEMGKEFARNNSGYLTREMSNIKPDHLMTIIYTSGTTGNPKGVMLTHNNLVSNVKAAAECIPFVDDDVMLSFLPLCHSYERMAGYYTAMSCGVQITYAESIETVRDNLIEVKPTVVTTVPRLFERIYNRIQKQVAGSSSLRQAIFHWAIRIGKKYALAKRERRDVLFLSLSYRVADTLAFRKIRAGTGGKIRFFVSGGAALPKELGEFFEAVGITILEGYGLSESSPVISVNRIDGYKFGTVGKPIPGVDVTIAADGEILARGPNIMKGYWKNPDETKQAIDSDGWLHTGDIGEFDGDGSLRITDRKKHLFVSSGGKNIAPQPIENLFAQCSYIDQFVLIGDKRMYCTALIVPDFEAVKDYARRNGISFSKQEDLVVDAAIRALFQQEIDSIQKDLANFERVRKFTLLDKPLTVESGELTPTQKIRRKVVEERYQHLIVRMYEGVG